MISSNFLLFRKIIPITKRFGLEGIDFSRKMFKEEFLSRTLSTERNEISLLENKKNVIMHELECNDRWQSCNQCYYFAKVKATTKITEKSVVNESKEKCVRKIISLPR